MRRILVGTDLSPAADVAVRRACRIGSEIRGEVRVIFAVPGPASEDKRSASEDALAAAMERVLPLAPPPLTTGVSFGPPGAAMIEEAEEFAPDLVVIGAHGGDSEDRMIGSTAIALIRDLSCPVLVALGPDSQAYRRVLAAREDRSGDRLIEVASRIPSIRDLFLVEGSDRRPGFDLGAAEFEDGSINSEQMNALLDQAVDTGLESGAMTMHPIVGPGGLMNALTEAWRKVKPDLAIVTRHGGSGMSWLFNDCAMETTLLTDPGDVLILP